jgi:hypothetical protein
VTLFVAFFARLSFKLIEMNSRSALTECVWSAKKRSVARQIFRTFGLAERRPALA